MAGHRRWYVVIALAVVVAGGLGVAGTQVELSRAKEHPCGTPLRIDLREANRLIEASIDARDPATVAPTEESRRLERMGIEAGDRCKDRQRLALLGLAIGGALAAAAVAVSTYQLGRRAGRRD